MIVLDYGFEYFRAPVQAGETRWHLVILLPNPHHKQCGVERPNVKYQKRMEHQRCQQAPGWDTDVRKLLRHTGERPQGIRKDNGQQSHDARNCTHSYQPNWRSS